MSMDKYKKLQVGSAMLYLQDALLGMKEMEDNSVDLAISDPPYGVATNASWNLINNHGLNGFGGAWKLSSNEWDKITGDKSFAFTIAWLAELKRLVKPTGSIWIHATYHNSGFVNVACQMLGLEIINEIVWYKRNAFPNLSNRRITASHETIYWVHTGGKKRQYKFNSKEVKEAHFPEDNLKTAGKQLRTVWDIPNNKDREEIKYGAHPTQKPLRLTNRLFLISGIKDGKVLIPFLGSGTEAVAAIKYGMSPIGFELSEEYFNVANKRIQDELNRSKQSNLFDTKMI